MASVASFAGSQREPRHRLLSENTKTCASGGNFLALKPDIYKFNQCLSLADEVKRAVMALILARFFASMKKCCNLVERKYCL